VEWGLGLGDWPQSPIPNPQSPIPNPQSPFLLNQFINQKEKLKILFKLIDNLIK